MGLVGRFDLHVRVDVRAWEDVAEEFALKFTTRNGGTAVQIAGALSLEHRPCKFYSSGRCTKGSRCPYAHDVNKGPLAYCDSACKRNGGTSELSDDTREQNSRCEEARADDGRLMPDAGATASKDASSSLTQEQCMPDADVVVSRDACDSLAQGVLKLADLVHDSPRSSSVCVIEHDSDMAQRRGDAKRGLAQGCQNGAPAYNGDPLPSPRVASPMPRKRASDAPEMFRGGPARLISASGGFTRVVDDEKPRLIKELSSLVCSPSTAITLPSRLATRTLAEKRCGFMDDLRQLVMWRCNGFLSAGQFEKAKDLLLAEK